METDHLALVFRERAERFGDKTAVRYRADGEWREMSWRTFSERIRAAGRALVALGVPEGGRVGIFSANRPEWTIADVGSHEARAVPVPIYPTNTAKQAEYIIDDAEIRVLFVGVRDQYEKARSLVGPGRQLLIVAFDETTPLDPGDDSMYFSDFLRLGDARGTAEEIEARLGRASRNDLLTLIYTSGTTGEPKGVMLTHTCAAEALRIHDLRLLDPNENDVSLCFLPLSHVFERCWTWYALSKGMTNCYLDDPTQVVEALQQTRPTIMCAVPRFYEKIYATVSNRLLTAPPLKRALFNWAIKVGRAHGLLRKDGLPIPALLALRHRIADALVLAKLRAIVGGRIKFFPCAGAPLAQEIEEFFYAAGVFICYGYGLTETTATVTCHEYRGFTFGTVGKPMPGVEVKIGENDEILVRGATVMKGYYHKPAATAEAFVDGWFRTGDAGAIDAHGNLIITDRIKDLIKTSGGKYIAPQMIEARVGSDHLVEQVVVIGEGRRFVSALLVPSFVNLEEAAKAKGITFSSREELIANPAVVALYQQRIDAHNSELARYEQIKKFTLLPRELTVEAGEITPTLKIKRKQVAARYQDVIDAMYV